MIRESVFASVMSAALMLCTGIIVRHTPGYDREEEKYFLCYGFAGAYSALLYFLSGWSMTTLKGMALMLIFLFASLSDLQTRHVGDGISAMLLLTGFISQDVTSLLFNAAAAAFVFGIMFVGAVCLGSGMGGADVKLSGAAVFAIGAGNGFAGLIMGLFAAVILNLIGHNKTKGFPFIPYLAAGFLTAYLF